MYVGLDKTGQNQMTGGVYLQICTTTIILANLLNSISSNEQIACYDGILLVHRDDCAVLDEY